MSWRKKTTMQRQYVIQATVLFATLTAFGVAALAEGWLTPTERGIARTPDSHAGFRAGGFSTIPREIRLRMENGWSAGVAEVTGPRHLTFGGQNYVLAHVEPLGHAAAELERLAGGQWVACIPAEHGAGVQCSNGSADLAHALISAGVARAVEGSPLGLVVADQMAARLRR